MEEQHVWVVAAPPPPFHMAEPRAEFHVPFQESIEELRKGSLEAVVAPVEMVIGNRYVLAAAGNIDVLARPLGNVPIGQVTLENAGRRQRLETLPGLERTLKPGAALGDVGNRHVAVGRQL